MSSVMSQIRKRVVTPDGTGLVRGAQSRLAEELGCARNTVMRYFFPGRDGVLWEPSAEKLAKLRELVKKDWRPFTLKTGPIAQKD